MENKEKKKRPLSEKLKNRYRLVVLNDDTFEEKFALRLTPLGILILIGAITIVMTFLVTSLVAFTPIREYIPGYGNVDQKRELMALSARADSLEQSMEAKDWFIQNISDVLSGKTEGKPEKPKKDTSLNYSGINVKASANDSILRNEIESADKYSLNISDKTKPVNSISSFVFFSPVKGLITGSFNLREEHYGVDVSAKENEFIKSTLDGTVVFAGFTSADGYVIQIQHNNNLMSVYKHNSEITVKVGDYVKAGRPIAIIGNSGETSNGPHLHFELWYNGSPINPQDYVLF
ncbi:MAG: M23 family metallopeptidase [Bacteroidota bacterium]|nr:M23 family metallopeptidase [Bacteroidota bacterium]